MSWNMILLFSLSRSNALAYQNTRRRSSSPTILTAVRAAEVSPDDAATLSTIINHRFVREWEKEYKTTKGEKRRNYVLCKSRGFIVFALQMSIHMPPPLCCWLKHAYPANKFAAKPLALQLPDNSFTNLPVSKCPALKNLWITSIPRTVGGDFQS